jgi:hypothetical protein
MKSESYFEETNPVYKIVNNAMYNITELKRDFYDSIFTTPEYEVLDEVDKDAVVGILLANYGLSIKEFIDICIGEKSK